MLGMFNPQSGIGQSQELIPAGQLAWVALNITDKKNSKETMGEYFAVELIVLEGPYEKRRIFENLMSPFDSRNSEGAHKMAIIALTRIFEACRIFDPANPESYGRFNHLQGSEGFDTIGMALQDHAKRLGVKVKIEKGTQGHPDKNKVAEWLSPNPESNGYPGWEKLIGGADKVSQARQSAFTPAAPAPVASVPAFAQPQPAPAVAAPAPGQPAFSAPAGATPGWLQKKS